MTRRRPSATTTPRTLVDLIDGSQGAWTPGSATALVAAAEAAVAGPDDRAGVGPADWRRYLDATGDAAFLSALPDRAWRYRWAETSFAAIHRGGYTLHHMLERQVRRDPRRPFFRDDDADPRRSVDYAELAVRLQLLAGVFLARSADPRVAIFAENSVDTASADLACLVHGLFVTPLNVHFDVDTLVPIFDRLGIDVVVTDDDEREEVLAEIASRAKVPFQVLRAGPPGPASTAEALDHAVATLDVAAARRALAARPPIDLDRVQTVMYTSGSTGEPKAVAFTHGNLVTKRFARAAALPAVGRDEVLLCYLPLYHTFGRFLEMLGMLYWGGTYVFAGNPSLERLLLQLSETRPTGLIGIPLRWSQIREAVLERVAAAREAGGAGGDAAGGAGPGLETRIFRSIVGDRLRWGLSAAGHLDPRVFRFFQRHGVDLMSGFGMTEATGGITMTPPGEYRDGSVGLPLPGAYIRLGDEGELQVSGPYVARYLPEAGEAPGAEPMRPAGRGREAYWLRTGDLFQEDRAGHLAIVDRIKDIYKNNRGQTIAPRRVEDRFIDVPGLRRVFLVGDGRDYNVLLMVPDPADPVLRGDPESVDEYVRQIIRAANTGLAPYERVVNYALLDRDFDAEHGELTSKASYRRKTIESNFHEVIDGLYRRNYIELAVGGLTVRIPRWFFRDLGILESEVVVSGGMLLDRQSGNTLQIARAEDGWVRVGDLEYRPGSDTIELGLFARQPRLWAANDALVAFAPEKDGWDVPLGTIEPVVRLPRAGGGAGERVPVAARVRDERLGRIHQMGSRALFGSRGDALRAVEDLASELRAGGARHAEIIRSRLGALATHSDEELRCVAYRVLLVDEPVPAATRAIHAFVESGLTFLNESSLREIARADIRRQHLFALRRRLFQYRRELSWPAADTTRDQFLWILALLERFAVSHPEYFPSVRSELAAWALHREDPALSDFAAGRLEGLSRWYRDTLESRHAGGRAAPSPEVIVFDETFHPEERLRVIEVLTDPTFLAESILLAFSQESFLAADIAPEGIWVSRLPGLGRFELHRVSVNLRDGRHFDLLLTTGAGFGQREVHDTVLWFMALAEVPGGVAVVPRLGVYRADLGALSVAYVSDPTAWDRIRQFMTTRGARTTHPRPSDWRRLYVRSMAAIFRVWRLSEGRIVPGAISPENVAVPEDDFREGAMVLSLAGRKTYRGTLHLVAPLVRNFYRQTAAHYPRSAEPLRLEWMLDACMEELGPAEGAAFLHELARVLEGGGGAEYSFRGIPLESTLDAYLGALEARPYLPLALHSAIDRYAEWEAMNPGPTSAAREEEVQQLYRLYRLDQRPQFVRYHLYRHTYFAHLAGDAARAFETLLETMARNPLDRSLPLEELSGLQAELADPADREVFSRMVLPRTGPAPELQFLAFGAQDDRTLVVRTEIEDRHGIRYGVREPTKASEVGYLFRLLFDSGFQVGTSRDERFLVVVDEQERVVGGASFVFDDAHGVSLEGLAVSRALERRGIASALLEDFCARMTGIGITVVKTGFFLRRFYTARKFRADARWGGLVRILSEPDAAERDAAPGGAV